MYPVTRLFLPRSLGEALELLEKARPWPLAGGTDVFVKMRRNKLQDVSLMSLEKIPDMAGIRELPNGDIAIGAMATFTAIAESGLIQRRVPMLKTAALSMGGPQIQNMATIGGNVCNGATSADSAPSLLALNALLELQCAGGERLVPIREFYLGPGKVIRREEELMTRIILPAGGRDQWAGVYIKMSTRKAMDISTLGVAVVCETKSGGAIQEAAIALGTAGPVPIRCGEAETLLQGRIPEGDLFLKAGIAARQAANPRTSWRAGREFRQALIEGLVERALKQAYAMAGETG
ncbi:MAG: xanthine dehydrogenase FAD-binding subunit XdhB [Spirochaetaceae bacterium]|jgi:xanthine dehydrogenase FAD-binding subunit|nr:xanthine dehydrogenase FAD-binding subunit XdhB [Spirochaetaceae bacterium]